MQELSKTEIDRIKKQVTLEVGKRIREIREKKGLSQVELAHMILSDRQYLYKIETGRVGISVSKLAIIAKALGIEYSELLD